ncbi:MAG: hypothetical protein JST00_25840 [Deltaproteobacteria bacterium]|nr:hypothetical protein [Deltaproteobacteria bacterium]
MPAPLVLVRWHGEVIATSDAFPHGFHGPPPEGVTIEVVDVSAERKGLNLRPAVPVLLLVGLLASVILHAGLGAGVAVAAWFAPPQRPASGGIMPPQNDQSGALDPVLKVAANDPPPEPAKDTTPPKPEPTPPKPAANEPQEEIPALVDEQASSAPPGLPEEPTPSEIISDGASGSDDITAGPTACAKPPVAANSGPTCRRNVVFKALQKSPGCYVDTVAQENQTGVLTFPCNGDGAASLRFGNKTFHGAVVNGKVDVCTGTEYLFVDHCKWTSAQRVTGSVGNGELHFTYGEAPKAGQQNCAMKCGATATISVGALPN